MIEPRLLDEISQRFSRALPPGLRQLQGELEKNFRTGLQTALAKLDLVTREEFDVQQAVLARTRSRLEALERQVADLEARAATAADNNKATGQGS